jgi:predicted dehydrogenase
MTRRFRTALVGAGRVGASYADDPQLARHYRYASHAQVLSEHPAFEWGATVDANSAALALAQARWGFAHAASTISELCERYAPEVLVLATPPLGRHEFVEACPGLKAVLCEKPLELDLNKAKAFLDLCRERGILLQVNYWRRCDELYRRLAEGDLEALIGHPQAVHGLYGNGIFNNGAHLIDTCRMLLGEVVDVRALGPATHAREFPIAGDFNVSCLLSFARGASAALLPIDFHNYRENGLDIWGQNGRLEFLNEDLTVHLYRQAPHRAVATAREIESDVRERLSATVSNALFRVYDNLAAALRGEGELLSPASSAWRTAVIIDAIRRSADFGSGFGGCPLMTESGLAPS